MCSGGYGWATGQWQGGDYLSEWRSYFPWASGFGSDRPADQPLLMFCLNSSHRYHLYRGVCDMRKSFNGLSGLVRNELNRDPARRGGVCIFESPSHPDEAAALGGRRVCALLRAPGKRHLYPACYGARPECGSLIRAGADDRRNHRGIGSPEAALSAVKKMLFLP